MNSPNAVDYSFDPPDDLAHYRQAYADGVRGFCRYLSPSSGKDFTDAELREIHSLGPDAFAHFLWEGYADDALKGYTEGYADGLATLGKISALQQQTGYKQRNVAGVSFAVDFDTTSGNWPALESYFKGVRAAVATKIRVGCYGEADIIDHLIGKGLIDFGFQTYAWSGGRVTSNAALYQYLNGQKRWSATVDYCRVNDARKLGAWYPPASPNNVPYPSPTTTPPSGDDDMMDQASFNKLMHGYLTTQEGQDDIRMAVLYSGRFARDANGEYHTLSGWFSRLPGYKPFPAPAKHAAKGKA